MIQRCTIEFHQIHKIHLGYCCHKEAVMVSMEKSEWLIADRTIHFLSPLRGFKCGLKIPSCYW